ncbi:Putative DNA-binding domain protein [Acididesulfobacillus acetoxydans]|uniref:DNA-binding domain protein n=1 Tax=Acididesulfobacillus acetoxydans TaxID=1561005 RepID=A0A8S0Y3N9_9FIRM|nr:MerR family transcriptional regulator [Acididesulfobacillus acetoxydans]CAA7602255.1 Putative DNA-binding domain protein [Acididesulfobacillus acetoxydans]CEJ07527.1 Predicted transcriptional regulator [Acididesulfobacillus acetoxydans]
MEYTVKQVAEMTGVTVKTLHHYHKISLLAPCKVTEAGYRLYGKKELERLQQILFYRELDFSLADIKQALESESDRLECLGRQQELLYAQRQRADRLLVTIAKSIHSTMKGESMSTEELFEGFDKQGWEKALKPQQEYLKEKYNVDLTKKEIDPKKMNEQAAEAKRFMNSMRDFLRAKLPADDETVQKALTKHLQFLQEHGTQMDANAFLVSTRFFAQDDFHRNMLEDQQIGLSYYLLAVADKFASPQ